MNSLQFEIGEYVSVKDIEIESTAYFFIWALHHTESGDYAVININPLDKKFSDRLSSDEMNSLHLFNGFSYSKVKTYLLLKKKTHSYERYFLNEIQLLIKSRNSFHPSTGTFLFKRFIRRLTDAKYKADVLIPYINSEIFLNKYSGFFTTDNTGELRPIVVLINQLKAQSFLLNVEILFVLNEHKEMLRLADEIEMKEGLSFIKKARDEINHLNAAHKLFRQKDNFVKGVYAPQNTTKDKPIVFELNSSYFEMIEPYSSKFENMLLEFEKWRDSLDSKEELMKSIAFEKAYLFLDGESLLKIQREFLSDFIESIPVNKIVKGKKSIDYSLSLMIPLFQYLNPNEFNPAFDRKTLIRIIKEFLAGKF